MDERVTRLTTPEDCERFAENARDRDRPDLARQARRRAIELRSTKHATNSAAEREALQAIYAYEELLTRKNGRRTVASRTWQMVKRHGVLGAVERAVNRSTDTAGYIALAKMGLQDLSFEAVIVRHPDAFGKDALFHARQRLEQWETRS